MASGDQNKSWWPWLLPLLLAIAAVLYFSSPKLGPGGIGAPGSPGIDSAQSADNSAPAMRMRIMTANQLIIGGILVSILIAIGWYQFADNSAAVSNTAATQKTFSSVDSRETELNSLLQRKRFTVLNFWATWCGPCVTEMPSLIDANNQIDSDVQIIGVSLDEEGDVALRFARQRGINFLIATNGNEWAQTFGIRSIPTTIIFDQNGNAIARSGFRRNMVGWIKSSIGRVN